MEIKNMCLDCKFSNWPKEDDDSGFCEWEAPFLVPNWLAGADIVGAHNYNLKRRISKTKPHINCPVWEEKTSATASIPHSVLRMRSLGGYL